MYVLVCVCVCERERCSRKIDKNVKKMWILFKNLFSIQEADGGYKIVIETIFFVENCFKKFSKVCVLDVQEGAI